MTRITIFKKCSTCNGTGVLAGSDGSNSRKCSICGGDGEHEEHELKVIKSQVTPFLGDLEDKLNDVLDKLEDIKEKMDE